jgi:hypothetical protein
MSKFYPSFRLVYNYMLADDISGTKLMSNVDEEVILQAVKRYDHAMKSIGVDFNDITPTKLEKKVSKEIRSIFIKSIGGAGHIILKDYIHFGKDFPLDYFFEEHSNHYILKNYIGCVEFLLPVYEVTLIYIYDTLQLDNVDTIQNGDMLKME